MSGAEHEWVRIRTPNSGRIYFHNPYLNSTVWTVPNGHTIKKEITSVQQGVAMGMRRKSLQRPMNHGQSTPSLINSTTGAAVETKLHVAQSSPSMREDAQNNTSTSSELININVPTNNPLESSSSSNNKKNKNTCSTSAKDSAKNNSKENKVNDTSISTGSVHSIRMSSTERTLGDRRATMQEANKSHTCSHLSYRNLTPRLCFLWLIPVLICVGVNLYYHHLVSEYGERKRPTFKYKNGTRRPLINLGIGHNAVESYQKYGIVYKTTRELRKEEGATSPLFPALTCQDHFELQTNMKLKNLCQGFCDGCVLGGDTNIYKNLTLWIAGIWTIIVLLSAIFVPMLAKFWHIKYRERNQGEFGQTLTTRDARVYLLLLLTFVVFAVMLFLIHHARVIDVPQGHSMYSFWIFYTCCKFKLIGIAIF